MGSGPSGGETVTANRAMALIEMIASAHATDAPDFDACIIGAGAVGLACGYALARRGVNVLVLEKEARTGAGVSSRNSEVIHAGLHYAPGSLKARLCVEGRRLLYRFLADHSVAFDKCGKLIVATEDG